MLVGVTLNVFNFLPHKYAPLAMLNIRILSPLALPRRHADALVAVDAHEDATAVITAVAVTVAELRSERACLGVVVDLAVAVLVHAVAGLGAARVDAGVLVVAVRAVIVGNRALGGVAAGGLGAEAVGVVVGVPGRRVHGAVLVRLATAVFVDVLLAFVADLVGAGVDADVLVVAVGIEARGAAGTALLFGLALLRLFLGVLDGEEAARVAVVSAGAIVLAAGAAGDALAERRTAAVAVTVFVVVPGRGDVGLVVAVLVDLELVADFGRAGVDGGIVVVAVLVRRVAVAVRVFADRRELLAFLERVAARTGHEHERDQRSREKSPEVDHLFLRPCFDILPRWKIWAE